MSYELIEDDKPHDVAMGTRNYLSCCHCGLVHEYRIRPAAKIGYVRLWMREMPRSTAGRRRAKEIRDKIIAMAKRLRR